MEKLKNWIMDNYCTQGYNMKFEELSMGQLDKLGDLVEDAKSELRDKSENREERDKRIAELKKELGECFNGCDQFALQGSNFCQNCIDNDKC